MYSFYVFLCYFKNNKIKVKEKCIAVGFQIQHEEIGEDYLYYNVKSKIILSLYLAKDRNSI
jgi:hypothetical protein